MTAQRQETSPPRPGIALICLMAGIWLSGLGFGLGLGYPGSAAHAATTERIVVNRFSGIAIDEIGHRVEPLDGDAGEAIDDDPLGGGCVRGQARQAEPNARQ